MPPYSPPGILSRKKPQKQAFSLLKSGLLLCAATLLFASCGNQQPEPEVYQPPEKHPVIFKKHSSPVTPDTADTPDTAARDSLCVAAVGDIMLGTSYPDDKNLPPDSAKGSFKNVLNLLRNNDVLVGNLEGTLLDTGAPANYRLHQLSRPWLFRMPVPYAGVLKDAGFNALSLANNHIGDFDEAGRTGTMHVLDSLGIHHGGQISRPASIFKINGVSYGFCAFAPNGYTSSILDLKGAARIVRKLKQQCDIVIVCFHGGGEGVDFEHVPFEMEVFVNEKRGDVNAFAHAVVDAGADLVFGNGPHVCRAIELYKGRLIAYSLGNFCTYKSVSVAGVCGLAPIVKAYVNKKGEFLSGQIVSAKQTHYAGVLPDPSNQAAARIKQLTEADFPQGALTIDENGTVRRISAF